MEELRNQVKVVIRAFYAGMPHVSAEIGEHGVDINSGGDPPVQIGEREIMAKVVRPWFFVECLLKTRGSPYFSKYFADGSPTVAS